VAALAAAWAFAPAAVPVYDGLQNPDEPYRYVAPPPGAKPTKPPTKAVAQVTVRGGQTGAAYANSAENGPQISLYLPAGALSLPPGATRITVTATPMAPSPPLPSDGTIWSNVYRITATAGGRAVQVIGKGPATPTIQMRAPSAQQPPPVFEYRVGDQWQSVRTLRVGNDIYQATAPALGDWALVRLTRQPSTASGGGGGVNVGLLAAGIAVLAIAAAIVAVRLSRTRRAPG
jgi:hypothetical protein